MNANKLFIACLAIASLSALSSCDTIDDHDDDHDRDHDHRRHERAGVTTTTTEETTLSRPYSGSATVETHTTRSY